MQGISLIPGWGTRSHMPQLKILQQRLSATAKQTNRIDIRRKNKKPKHTVVAY